MDRAAEERDDAASATRDPVEVVLAQEEARGLHRDYIGTEHLLLGLFREGDGVAARALGMLGLELSEARRQLEELIGRGSGTPPAQIPFTPRAKKALELALREALQLKHDYIGTEHILLGMRAVEVTREFEQRIMPARCSVCHDLTRTDRQGQT